MNDIKIEQKKFLLKSLQESKLHIRFVIQLQKTT
jgi:hypothetical protein